MIIQNSSLKMIRIITKSSLKMMQINLSQMLQNHRLQIKSLRNLSQNLNNMIRALSENGGVVFCGVDSTNIVSQMEAYQHPSAVVTAGLGRLLTAASLIGIMMKNTEDSVTLRVEGAGRCGSSACPWGRQRRETRRTRARASYWPRHR